MNKPVTFHLELTLHGIEPAVRRTLAVPGRFTLAKLHGILQILFGWEDCHLHEFRIGTTRYGDLDVLDPHSHEDEEISLAEALGQRKSLVYLYDFGDDWTVNGKVLKRYSGDLDTPECLDGAMAGPPEDCGGVWGFQEIREALADPDYSPPDDDDFGPEIPRNYDPSAFPREAVNKKLQRAYGRKSKGPKADPDALLGGYQLSKLNVIGAIVAALTERAPLSLDQVEARLTELGYPLPHGQQSLIKSIAKSPAVRTRHDGTLELETGETFRRATYLMSRADPAKKVEPVTPAEPEPLTGPVTAAELEEARPNGVFPPTLSVRRQLLLTLEAMGGKASLEDLVPEMEKFSRVTTAAKAQLTLNGSSAVSEQDGIYQIKEGRELDQIRAVYRAWTLPHRRHALNGTSWREKFEQGQADYRQRMLTEYRQAQTLRPAVVAVAGSPDEGGGDSAFALTLFDTLERRARWFTNPSEALEALRDYDILIGLNPRSSFERLGWEWEKITVDLTPTFKSRPLSNGKRKAVSTSEAVAMVTRTPLLDPAKLQKWLARGQVEKARAALEEEAQNLYLYWRFGVLHGNVLRRDEWMEVSWNERREPSLGRYLQWCLDDMQPLEVTLSNGRTGPFQPLEIEKSRDYHDRIHGLWTETSQRVSIELADILDCRYPYDIPEERLSTSIWI